MRCLLHEHTVFPTLRFVQPAAIGRAFFLRVLFIVLCIPWAIPASAQPDPDTAEITDPDLVAPEDDGLPFGLGWLEDTQRVSSSQANSLANSIDRFFGVPRSDLEAAYSSLRLSLNNKWVEAEGSEMSVRLRGRVYLPRINERISLVFSEDEGEGEDVHNSDPGGAEPEKTNVNLELNLKEKDNSRLDFRVGLRSSLKFRASMRYRLDSEVSEKWFHRLTQTFQFIDGRGFGSITRSELDRIINDTTLVRWTNELRMEEEFNGTEMGSEVVWVKRVDDQSAISVYGRVNAETNPDFISSYTTGIRFRQAIYKKWLFAEIEPRFDWYKEEVDDRREGQASLYLRLEMAIGKLD